MSNSVRSHRWQPTRLLHPWDSPGKNTGVGCHFLLQCIAISFNFLGISWMSFQISTCASSHSTFAEQSQCLGSQHPENILTLTLYLWSPQPGRPSLHLYRLHNFLIQISQSPLSSLLYVVPHSQAILCQLSPTTLYSLALLHFS